MPTTLSGMFAGAFGTILLGGFVAILACAYLVPVNIWRMAKNLRAIQQQLDRIATALERAPSSGSDEFRELELARRRRASTDTMAR